MSETSFSRKVIFPGADGTMLAARLELPVNEPHTYALFVHCFTCSKDSIAAFHISRELVQHGYAVLRFDFTGLGDSEGDFANTNFSSNVDDILKAVDFLRANFKTPELLIGHSLGGAAVLIAAQYIQEAKAIATIGAPADLEHIKHLFKEKLADIESDGSAQLKLAGRTFKIKKQFLEDLKKHSLLSAVATLKKALLILHSPQDDIVKIQNGYDLFAAATSTFKSFISLNSVDHLLRKKEDAAYVTQLLVTWGSRYLTNVVSQITNSASDTYVEVRESHQGLYTQEIMVGDHFLIADEPKATGGDDLGPGPYDFLLAALGACTSMTLRMYANLKNIPLTQITVKLKHDKIYAEDCENCEKEQSRLDRIERNIAMEGSLTDAQKEKLLQIADKCPVHRTLTTKNIINTKLIK